MIYIEDFRTYWDEIPFPHPNLDPQDKFCDVTARMADRRRRPSDDNNDNTDEEQGENKESHISGMCM